jgi:hypothetical protein
VRLAAADKAVAAEEEQLRGSWGGAAEQFPWPGHMVGNVPQQGSAGVRILHQHVAAALLKRYSSGQQQCPQPASGEEAAAALHAMPPVTAAPAQLPMTAAPAQLPMTAAPAQLPAPAAAAPARVPAPAAAAPAAEGKQGREVICLISSSDEEEDEGQAPAKRIKRESPGRAPPQQPGPAEAAPPPVSQPRAKHRRCLAWQRCRQLRARCCLRAGCVPLPWPAAAASTSAPPPGAPQAGGGSRERLWCMISEINGQIRRRDAEIKQVEADDGVGAGAGQQEQLQVLRAERQRLAKRRRAVHQQAWQLLQAQAQ